MQVSSCSISRLATPDRPFQFLGPSGPKPSSERAAVKAPGSPNALPTMTPEDCSRLFNNAADKFTEMSEVLFPQFPATNQRSDRVTVIMQNLAYVQETMDYVTQAVATLDQQCFDGLSDSEKAQLEAMKGPLDYVGGLLRDANERYKKRPPNEPGHAILEALGGTAARTGEVIVGLGLALWQAFVNNWVMQRN